MKNLTYKKTGAIIAGSAMLSSLLFAGTALANSNVSLGSAVNLKHDVTASLSANANAQGANTQVKAQATNDTDANKNDNDDSFWARASSTLAWLKNRPHATSTLATIITGTGQPVVGGTVTAVNGNTLTVTTATNVTYTVNASAATVAKGKTAATVSNISVGDKVVVQGAVSGTSITASSVIDAGGKASTTATTTPAMHPKGLGFWLSIGGFFKHLFGFF